LPLTGAQAAIGPLDDGRIAADQQSAGHQPVLHNWRTSHHQGTQGQLHHLFSALLARQCPSRAQGRSHLLQHAAVQGLDRGPEQGGHAWVQRANAATLVHGRHTVLQLVQHGFQPLMPVALGTSMTGQQHGVAECLTHRNIGIQQHAGHARLLCQIGHQARRHHGTNARRLEFCTQAGASCGP
jgi:hypothetical protein